MDKLINKLILVDMNYFCWHLKIKYELNIYN